jgi:hypothetical protein
MENDNTNWVIIGAIASVICAVVGILSLFDVNLKSAKSSETKEVVQKTSGPEYTKRADDNSSKNSNQISVEAVDLGLSVRWADKNVGASSPEEYGDYYAWGEIKSKRNYSINKYRWYSIWSDKLKKYCVDRERGKVDGKTVLENEDDVARVKWGDGWRIPTEREFRDLMNHCTWTWSVQNGTGGFFVTGRNGNSIFLPAAGYREDRQLINLGVNGFYLTNELNLSYDYWAVVFEFGPYKSWRIVDFIRTHGASVRPVYD